MWRAGALNVARCARDVLAASAARNVARCARDVAGLRPMASAGRLAALALCDSPAEMEQHT